MPGTVIILEEAAKDMELGRAFYDEQEVGIGLYFTDSLLSDIESLAIFQGIHRKVFGFHRMLSKRFPFAVYYDLKNDIVRVAAVLDMRRDPGWIRRKLRIRRID